MLDKLKNKPIPKQKKTVEVIIGRKPLIIDKTNTGFDANTFLSKIKPKGGPSIDVEPIEVIDEPIKAADEPVKAIELEEPIEVADEPIEVAYEPIEVVDEPIKVVDEPIEVVDEPIKVIKTKKLKKKIKIIDDSDVLEKEPPIDFEVEKVPEMIKIPKKVKEKKEPKDETEIKIPKLEKDRKSKVKKYDY